MGDRVIFICEFSSFQQRLREIRKKLQVQLRDNDVELIEAALMAASELLENAIKYANSGISFQLIIENDILAISVINKTAEGPELEQFKAYIGKIQQADDLGELYTARLTQLINETHRGPTRLGLIRIAYEGKFELAYRQEGDRFEVTATRGLR